MKKMTFGIGLALAIALVSLQSAVAQTSNASAKAAVDFSLNQILSSQIDNTQPPGTNQVAWTPIFNTQLKTSSNADVLMGLSLETGLFTQTAVSTKNTSGGSQQTATASSEIQVRLCFDIDGDGKCGGAADITAKPGNITYDKRAQTLIATLGKALSCTGSTLDTCTLTDQEINFILDTASAHFFNFALGNVGTGIHKIVAEARIGTAASVSGTGQVSDFTTSSAKGLVTNGSLVVESVRLTKDNDVVSIQ